MCSKLCEDNGSIDHIYPLRTFPHLKREKENLAWAHAYCNQLRGNMEQMLGILILSGEYFTALAKVYHGLKIRQAAGKLTQGQVRFEFREAFRTRFTQKFEIIY